MSRSLKKAKNSDHAGARTWVIDEGAYSPGGRGYMRVSSEVEKPRYSGVGEGGVCRDQQRKR